MNKLTIRAKITIWFIVILTLIVGLTYVVIFSVTGSVARHDAQVNLQDVVDWDLGRVVYEPAADSAAEDEETEGHRIPYGDGTLLIEDDFMELFGGIGVGIYNADGEILYGKDPIPRESHDVAYVDGELRTVASGEDTFYVYDRQMQIEGPGGEEDGADQMRSEMSGGDQRLWLRGAVDREQNQWELSHIMRICLILLPLLILLAAAGAYVITRRSLRPLGQMAQTAHSISSGSDLHRRISFGPESDPDANRAPDPASDDEVQQLAVSFNEMMQRLEDSFESEKQFTSDVSHELRTPMTVILAQCELALEQGDALTSAEALDALQVIRRQSSCMNEMIEDMLTFTRLDRHHEKYPFADVDFSALAKEVCEEFAAEHDIEPGIRIEGSESLLRRLLSNLISNGIRYGRPGGHVWVKLHRAGGDGEIVLTVADDGIGIAPEDLPRIFDRFYQADPARTGEGSGLGLSMVREIASIHGGTVEAASTLGEGSTFTVRF